MGLFTVMQCLVCNDLHVSNQNNFSLTVLLMKPASRTGDNHAANRRKAGVRERGVCGVSSLWGLQNTRRETGRDGTAGSAHDSSRTRKHCCLPSLYQFLISPSVTPHNLPRAPFLSNTNRRCIYSICFSQPLALNRFTVNSSNVSWNLHRCHGNNTPLGTGLNHIWGEFA